MLKSFLFPVLYLSLLATLSAQVYTPDPASPITREQSWRQDGPLAVRLVAPRNGAATAPIILTATNRPPRATIGNLAHENGRATFPGTQILVRYGWEGMAPEPPSGETSHVVWITAEVPPNTLPGNYRGQINITGAPSIPLQLEVGQWLAPRPSQFKVWQGYFNSPETIARYYEVEIWSDDHFALLESSLRLLGQVGTQMMYIPAAGRTHFGNHHSLVRWIGENPNAQPEFSALDRYFEMWDRLVGPPKIIVSYSYEGSWWGDPERYNTIQVTSVRRPGESGGTLTQWPHFTAPGQAAQWSRHYRGLQERIRARGWQDTELMVGFTGDGRNFATRIPYYREAAPGLRFATFTHSRGDPPIPDNREDNWELAGLNFGYAVLPYDPNRGRELNRNPLNSPGSWQNTFPYLTSLRSSIADNMGDIYATHPFFWRLKSLASVKGSHGHVTYRGFARQGFDFWPIDGRHLIGRYHRWNNLFRDNTRFMVHPGPQGALASHPMEMAREGNAATEAMTVLHDALTLPELRRKLDSGLAERAEAAYLGYYEPFHEVYQGGREGMPQNMAGKLRRGWDWQSQLRTLYDVAGEVAAATGQEADLGEHGSTVVLFRESEARSWTNREGRTITAMFVAYTPQGVQLLLPDLRQVAIPIDTLSPEDQTWIREKTGFRLWRNQQGAEIEARLIETDGERVTIERLDGQQFPSLPLSSFSTEDQRYVRENFSSRGN